MLPSCLHASGHILVVGLMSTWKGCHPRNAIANRFESTPLSANNMPTTIHTSSHDFCLFHCAKSFRKQGKPGSLLPICTSPWTHKLWGTFRILTPFGAGLYWFGSPASSWADSASSWRGLTSCHSSSARADSYVIWAQHTVWMAPRLLANENVA